MIAAVLLFRQERASGPFGSGALTNPPPISLSIAPQTLRWVPGRKDLHDLVLRVTIQKLSNSKKTLCTTGDFKHIGGHLRYVDNEGGALFSGHCRTKIKPEELPERYLYGRYCKRWGDMSAKGITDLVYRPNRSSSYYWEDDCLFISYGMCVGAEGWGR